MKGRYCISTCDPVTSAQFAKKRTEQMLKHFGCLTVLALAACQSQVSPEKAAEICEERARAALGPTGSIGVFANSSGESGARISIGVTDDFIKGRDPYFVYDKCVRQKSGQGPIRPLVLE